MTRPSPILLDRLRTLVDAYGANPDRWPADERAAAERLLSKSPDARRHRDAAAGLDALLDLAREPEPPVALRQRILAAVTPPQGDAAASIARRHGPLPASRRAGARQQTTAAGNTVLRRVIPAVLAAAGIVLVLWSVVRTERTTTSPAVTVAEIGTYDVPTDALLTGPGLDLLDDVPVFGCEGSGLGCLDPAPANHQSALTLEAYV